MHTTSELLTTIAREGVRLWLPIVLVAALAFIALALALTSILAVPAEPISVAPMRWSA